MNGGIRTDKLIKPDCWYLDKLIRDILTATRPVNVYQALEMNQAVMFFIPNNRKNRAMNHTEFRSASQPVKKTDRGCRPAEYKIV